MHARAVGRGSSEQLVDRRGELAPRLEPLGRILCEAAHDQAIDLGRDRGDVLARPGGRLHQMHRDDVADPLRDERRTPGDQVVEHAPDRVDIGASIDLASTAALLGRHERRGPHDDGGLGLVRRVVDELRDPEVDDLRALAAGYLWIGDEEDVLGLEITVHDAGGVGGAERARHLPHDAQRLAGSQTPEPAQTLVERLALEQLHHDVGAAVLGVAEIEDLHDPRIGHRGRGARLVEEPPHGVGLERGRRVQHLDRRLASDHRVLGEPDGPHSAFTDLLEHAIPTDLRARIHSL